MKRLGYFLDVSAAICGSVWATISVCNPNPKPWSLFGWTFALFVVGRLLCVSRKYSKPVTSQWIWRVPLAAVAVFCFTMLTMIFMLYQRNPGPMAFEDMIVVLVLTSLGTLSTFFVVRLSFCSK